MFKYPSSLLLKIIITIYYLFLNINLACAFVIKLIDEEDLSSNSTDSIIRNLHWFLLGKC